MPDSIRLLPHASPTRFGQHHFIDLEEEMEPVHDSGHNNSIQDGVESIVGENHCEKEKWHDMLPDEEDMICRLHRLLGDRWELISGRIPNRTAEEVERYWRTKESKLFDNKVFRPVCVRAKPSPKLAMMSSSMEKQKAV